MKFAQNYSYGISPERMILIKISNAYSQEEKKLRYYFGLYSTIKIFFKL